MKLLLNKLNDHFGKVLVILFVILFASRFSGVERLVDQLKPKLLYQFNLVMTFEKEQELSITTFLPQHNERQSVIKEQFFANGLELHINEDSSGKSANWVGTQSTGQISYRYLLSTQALNYTIDPDITIPIEYPEALAPYLEPTEFIQVQHPDVSTLWQLIKPNDESRVLDVLRSIHQYTYAEIEPVPFKGVTDALTTLRLKTASCNGKSRLFIALARLNNLPARLVGGVIMNGKSKKTSHQWVEVLVEKLWVPFGPTNDHFASLPQNYLELYKGDKSLFTRSVDINFDYQFSSQKNLVAPAVYLHQQSLAEHPLLATEQELPTLTPPSDAINVKQTDPNSNELESPEALPSVSNDKTFAIDITGILLSMGVEPKTIGLFLLFPICTLLITFLRNIIGVKTFGIFLPMLIGAACIYTGFLKGILFFLMILTVSYIAHHFLQKMKLLKIPRLAAIITINTLFFMTGLIFLGDQGRLELGMIGLFPVIIISFIAEKIHKISEEGNWVELLNQTFGTLFSIGGCYLLLNSFVLQGLFSFYPETFLLVLAIQIYIGKWTGIRISELYRFKPILSNTEYPVIGINGRNREFIYRVNTPELLQLAADKLATKKVLTSCNIPTPSTLIIVEEMASINKLSMKKLARYNNGFALKPNKGSQGKGILIVKKVANEVFYDASDKQHSLTDIKQHVAEIVSGSFAQSGELDTAYFEPLVNQHQSLQAIAEYGLADIRVILSGGKIISAMLRIPTKTSSGKANLHQGAIGVGLDIETGLSNTAKLKSKEITHHPDTLASLIDIEIPFWKLIREICESCYHAVPLGYIGIDICIDELLGPLVLEINGRPGIEIQNIQGRGFYNELSH
jgi:alpha-L-glutamate ligase-like protein